MHLKSVAGIFLLLAIPALADQIVLKNGDRLTGLISKADGKELVIKTDYAGDVTVKFDAIQGITSRSDITVGVGKKTVVGPVTTKDDVLVIATKAEGSIEVPRSSVTMLRSPADEAAYEKSLHPGMLEGWKGGLNLGFALTTGNSETKNLNVAFNAVRAGFHDKLTLYANSIYAANDKIVPPLTGPQTTANSTGGGAIYNHDFSARMFWYVSGDFFTNALQDLNLRAILGGGAGVHLIKNPVTTLDFLAGLNYTHESFSDVPSPTPPPPTYSYTNSLAALTVGDTFSHKIGKGTVVTQSFLLYPDLSKTGQYRGTFALGTVTKLSKWLGWQNTFGDVFDTNPPAAAPRIERNDVQLSTGLNIAFTH